MLYLGLPNPTLQRHHFPLPGSDKQQAQARCHQKKSRWFRSSGHRAFADQHHSGGTTSRIDQIARHAEDIRDIAGVPDINRHPGKSVIMDHGAVGPCRIHVVRGYGEDACQLATSWAGHGRPRFMGIAERPAACRRPGIAGLGRAAAAAGDLIFELSIGA